MSDHQEDLFDGIADSYSDLLNENLKLFGGNARYYQYNKIDCLKRWVIPVDRHLSIMDYGCGIGVLSGLLGEIFPDSTIFGYDISKESIKVAREKWRHLTNLCFSCRRDRLSEYHLIIVNNVLHHIGKKYHEATLLHLKDRLYRKGKLVVFEHNPYNPFTLFVVKTGPFDVDAELILPGTLETLARACGFRVVLKRYITFFPSFLKRLKRIEPFLAPLPFGAQYMLVLEPRSFL